MKDQSAHRSRERGFSIHYSLSNRVGGGSERLLKSMVDISCHNLTYGVLTFDSIIKAQRTIIYSKPI